MQFVYVRASAYPQFGGDFRQIRIRAVSDFTGGRLPVSGIEREHVIAEACLQGAKLAELNDRKQQLERQLVEIYGIKLDKPRRVERSSEEKEKEVTWPIYAVGFVEDVDTWIERVQVAEAGAGAIVYTFKDGKRGLVYEPKGVELSMLESLSVPRLIQVDPSVAQALKRQLREASAEGSRLRKGCQE
jgi:DNA primase large subunit